MTDATTVTTETHVDKASAWDEIAKKNAEIARLQSALALQTEGAVRLGQENDRLRAELEKSRKCDCGAPLSRSCPTCGDFGNPEDHAMTEILERLANRTRSSLSGVAETRLCLYAIAEIERLQATKTAALKVADERTMQNTALRQENERLKEALDIARTGLLTIEQKSEETLSILTRAAT